MFTVLNWQLIFLRPSKTAAPLQYSDLKEKEP